MKPQEIQQIQMLTLDTAHFLYQHNVARITPLLHPDVTWISSQDCIIRTGKDAVSKALCKFQMPVPACAASMTCQTIYFDWTTCTLLCTCAIARNLNHRITLVWTLECNVPKLLHIHGSITPREPVLIFTGRQAEQYYLHPDDICYVEADNTCAHIVCENRNICICQTISAIQEQLPAYFLKVHRSFLVNPHYIVSLKRYNLELRSGVILPVPEKKYKWIKEYLNGQA